MSVRVLSAHIGHVLRAHAAAISPTSWSIGLCARWDSLPALNTGYGLIVKGTYDGDIVYVLRHYNDGGTYKLQAGIRVSGTDHLVSLAFTPTLGRWYEVDATHATGGTCHVYVAEREERIGQARPTAYSSSASGSIATAVPTSTASLFVGAATGGGGVIGGFDGSFCSVRIYDAKVAQSTLEGRLSQRLVGTEANLVLYYPCDEQHTVMGGTTVYDRASGAGRDGTFTNSPRWADDPAGLWYDVGDTSGLPLLGPWSWTRGRRTVITASDEASGYEATRLRSPRQAIATRTANATGVKRWVLDFGRPVPFQALTIRNWNLSSAAVVLLEIHSADSWASPSASETVTYYPGEVTKILARRYCYRYVRLSVTDAAASGGYHQLGTLDLWPLIEISGPSQLDGEESSLSDPSTAVETQHGDRVGRDLTPSRDGKWSLADVRRDEALEIARALEEGGACGAPVLFTADPRRALPAAVYGYATATPEHALQGSTGDFRAVSGLAIASDRP